MWHYFLHAFKEVQININTIPMNIWESELNLSNGRITESFSKWLVETHLKLAKNAKVEKDHKVEGQFLVKDHKGRLIYIVRDFVIAEHAHPGDFLKAEKLIIDKKAEAEGKDFEHIKKTFKYMASPEGLTFKGPGHFHTTLEIEKKLYVFPFTKVVELAPPFKKRRIYIQVTDVRGDGERVSERLGKEGQKTMLENVGKALALWHLKAKNKARSTPGDVGFATIVHGHFIPEYVLYNAKSQKITFLNNEHLAENLKKGGETMWRDIKTFIAHLTHEQKDAFLSGYAIIFKKKGYTVEKMKAFLNSETFKNL